MIRKPMLSGKVGDVKDIKYPVLCTPKLDGIRALKVDGKLVSRNFKPIPNNYIRETFEKFLPDGVDGELILKNGKACGAEFNKTSSAVMSEDGTPDVIYHIFDYVEGGLKIPYHQRMKNMASKLHNMFLLYPVWFKPVYPVMVRNEDELLEYEQKCLSEGYEGIMLRSVDGPYKEGRSSEREGYLLKLKRFDDSEAEVIGYEEKMTNENEAEKDAFGHQKRSSKKEGLVPANTMGTIKVRDLKSKIEFGIGTGFDDLMRKKIWDNQKEYLGKIVKYKSQACGKVEKPRFPVFLGFRNKNDM